MRSAWPNCVEHLWFHSADSYHTDYSCGSSASSVVFSSACLYLNRVHRAFDMQLNSWLGRAQLSGTVSSAWPMCMERSWFNSALPQHTGHNSGKTVSSSAVFSSVQGIGWKKRRKKPNLTVSLTSEYIQQTALMQYCSDENWRFQDECNES